MPTNTLGNYNETFFAQEALIQLEKALGMAMRVHRGYDDESKRRGDTINIRRPSTFTAQNAPSTAQNMNTESVGVVLDQWKEVKFALTDKELSLSADEIIQDHIQPAAYALADAVDQSLAALYTQIPWDVTMSATPALSDINALRRVMVDNSVPTNDGRLHVQVATATEEALLNAMSASGQQGNTQDPALRNAAIGRLFGMEVFANQNAPTHTSGVSADAVGAANGAVAVDATTFSFDGVTAAGTFKAGDSFVFAGHTQRYVLTADATASSGAVTGAAFTPALKTAVADNEVVTFSLAGASKLVDLAFHRNFAALATAPLSTVGSQLGAKMSTATYKGVTLRSRMYYDGDESEVNVALDILYGVKLLDPNLAVRGFQN